MFTKWQFNLHDIFSEIIMVVALHFLWTGNKLTDNMLNCRKRMTAVIWIYRLVNEYTTNHCVQLRHKLIKMLPLFKIFQLEFPRFAENLIFDPFISMTYFEINKKRIPTIPTQMQLLRINYGFQCIKTALVLIYNQIKQSDQKWL